MNKKNSKKNSEELIGGVYKTNKFNTHNYNKMYLILGLIIVILFLFNTVLYLKKVAKPKQEEELQAKNAQTVIKKEEEQNNKNKKAIPQSDDEIKKYLSTLAEGNRMQYYCGQFINYIDNEEYEKAYNLLYDEFKQKYFPTLADFENYAKSYYPRFFGVQYDDVDRYNDTYVLRLKIVDYKASEEDSEKIQRVVVREYDYNNFVISFSVEKDDGTTENTENTTNTETNNQEEKPNVIIN